MPEVLFSSPRIYRPPSESDSQPDEDYLARFYNSLDSAAAEGKEIIVNGDFNCDYLPKKPSIHRLFMESTPFLTFCGGISSSPGIICGTNLEIICSPGII